MKQVLQRLALTVSSLLLLTAIIAAGSANFIMTVRDGFICVREVHSGQWVRETRIRADTLRPHDRLLLETGILLRDQQAFTRALEDYCS